MSTPARVKHLLYEVRMLAETRRKLLAKEFDDNWGSNALIESFCVHARNLNEFFLEYSNRPDTLKASSFTDDGYKLPRRTKKRRALFIKIDKQIAHLTKQRTAMARRKIGDPQRELMFAFLYDDLRNFDRHLKRALRRKWKVRFALPVSAQP